MKNLSSGTRVVLKSHYGYEVASSSLLLLFTGKVVLNNSVISVSIKNLGSATQSKGRFTWLSIRGML